MTRAPQSACCGFASGRITWNRSQCGTLTQAAYCRGHALNGKTFAGWIKRFNPKPAADLALTLVPLAVRPPVAAGELLLRHASGWQWALPCATAPAWLAELLRGLV